MFTIQMKWLGVISVHKDEPGDEGNQLREMQKADVSERLLPLIWLL